MKITKKIWFLLFVVSVTVTIVALWYIFNTPELKKNIAILVYFWSGYIITNSFIFWITNGCNLYPYTLKVLLVLAVTVTGIVAFTNNSPIILYIVCSLFEIIFIYFSIKELNFNYELNHPNR
jgi:hypothetical protein